MNQPLLVELDRYRRSWARLLQLEGEHQNGLATRFDAFVKQHPDCFERTLPEGHLTGSALVTDPSLDRVLLTLHRKLGRWLQLGGHADGHPHLWEVALREAREESGLSALRFFEYRELFDDSERAPLIFDLDIHAIPARRDEAEHLHYDARYLLIADEPERIQISDESSALRWFNLSEAYAITEENSMRRQFDKLAFLRAQLAS